jgi:hypothetical protein
MQMRRQYHVRPGDERLDLSTREEASYVNIEPRIDVHDRCPAVSS